MPQLRPRILAANRERFETREGHGRPAAIVNPCGHRGATAPQSPSQFASRTIVEPCALGPSSSQLRWTVSALLCAPGAAPALIRSQKSSSTR
eukprot:3523310-Pleurochrysis_carterae.AAC.3